MSHSLGRKSTHMKSIMKIASGIVVGFVLLIGGCTAILGASMSGDDGDTTFVEDRAAERESKKASAPSEADASTEKSEKSEPDLTAGEENSIAKAEQYLEYSAFSRGGLIKQLEFEGFSRKDATFGVDQLKVNWNAQAAAKAEEYLDQSAFSRDGLVEQLEFEGFTQAQAAYGMKQAGL